MNSPFGRVNFLMLSAEADANRFLQHQRKEYISRLRWFDKHKTKSIFAEDIFKKTGLYM